MMRRTALLQSRYRKKKRAASIVRLYTGNIAERAGIITGDIGRHPTDRKRMAIVRENGKHATTHFEVLERFGGYTFVACRLETGRTHQIRVHMTSIGHPLVGDAKYTSKKNPFAIAGQALHSLTLTLAASAQRRGDGVYGAAARGHRGDSVRAAQPADKELIA